MTFLCETCNQRAVAALVELDGKASYLCRPCTEAVQAAHADSALCDNCHGKPTNRTLPRDGKPFSVCADCVPAPIEDNASNKSKRKKKTTTSAAVGGLPSFGIAAEQGRRATMEDAEIAVLNLAELFPEHAPVGSQFYGVYDGHGGERAAAFVKETLHHKIVASESFKAKRFAEACERGYAACDDELLKLCDAEQWPDGSTAVVALVVDGLLITSCVGDSELVASVNGVAQCRSFKHKPAEASERARIQAAGGCRALRPPRPPRWLSRARLATRRTSTRLTAPRLTI